VDVTAGSARPAVPACDTALVDQHTLAYIGLGANVGAAREALEHAVAALSELPGYALVAVSRLYRTRPVGLVEQPDFLNAAVALRAPAGATPRDGAMALLLALKDLERTAGRAQRQRWGPRELDLDLLLFGDAEIHVERHTAARSADPARTGVQWLDVPHPLAGERSFVLAPLAELAPELVPPGWESTVGAARARALAAEGADAVRVVGEWDHRRGRWRDPGPAAPK
jgi:2-amino-4-hydroxy-6-hydroxymethyldihydropteridine diphosphokinase